MTTTNDQIIAIGQAWAEAEQSGDVDGLDAIADERFRLVGPFGFVLDKQQWLARYADGDLVTTSLRWEDASVADYGDVAIAIGLQRQEADYRGHPSDGEFRVSHVFARRDGAWRLLGMHLSLASPPQPTA